MRSRWSVAILAAILISIVLSACSLTGSEAKSGGEVIKAALPKVEAALPRASRALHWAGAIAPTGGTLATVANGLGDAIDQGTSIKAQYERIAASDDPFGTAFVTATCYGLDNVAAQYRKNSNLGPASAQSWEEFLKSEIGLILRATPADVITKKVTEFNNAAELEKINPRVAYYYVKECILHRDEG